MSKKTTKKGDWLTVPDMAVLVTPSGKEITVSGGVYFAEEDGQYEIQHVTDEGASGDSDD